MENTGKPTILVVEDDPDLRRILGLQLRTEGFTVVEAEDGAAAFEVLQDLLPDCVVLDLMMPRMDGFAFLKRIRSLNRTADVPVLILTASEDRRHKSKSNQYMADAFLNKPYNLQELTEVVTRLCGEKSGST